MLITNGVSQDFISKPETLRNTVVIHSQQQCGLRPLLSLSAGALTTNAHFWALPRCTESEFLRRTKECNVSIGSFPTTIII